MDSNIKLLFSGIAILITFVAFVPYVRATLAGVTKPHVFSWLIWSMTSGIVFFAQLEAEGGVGAWPTGALGAITIFIAVLAFLKRDTISITKVDWLFLALALMSLPFWYFTANPLWAVVMLTMVDLLGFGPTIRKAHDFPHDENIPFFLLFLTRNAFALLALEHYSVATALFPISVSCVCLFLLILVSYRRNVVAPL